MKQWKENIDSFLKFASEAGVRMLMVGGGAVNFHGYQRHSADVDFWLDVTEDNLERLKKVFLRMGYEIEKWPNTVKTKQQNISVKFSPVDLDLELITNFSTSISFEQAFNEARKVTTEEGLEWYVISLRDLIDSKIKSGRPKDLLDVQELKRIHRT